ncbi:MAG: nuclear transport factor 2 family protein [Gemmatimonadaceae bacterium]
MRVTCRCLALSCVLLGCGETRPRGSEARFAEEPASQVPGHTLDSLRTLSLAVTDAWASKGISTFEQLLADGFVSYKMGVRTDKRGLIAMVRENRCRVVSRSLSNMHAVQLSADAYVLTYVGTFEGACQASGGRTTTLLSPTRSASIFVRRGGGFQGAFHGENSLRASSSADATYADTSAGDLSMSAPDGTRGRTAMADATTDIGATGNAGGASPSGTADEGGAIIRLHADVWKSVLGRAVRELDSLITPNATLVDSDGGVISNRGEFIRRWRATSKCASRTAWAYSDAVVSELAPTVRLLTVAARPGEGCSGRDAGVRYQSAAYVQESRGWRLAFLLESQAE